MRGVSWEDVRYVMPKSATTAQIQNDLPRIGRFVVATFRKDAFYTSCFEAFQHAAGWVEIEGGKVIALFAELETRYVELCSTPNSARPGTFSDVTRFLAAFAEKVSAWSMEGPCKDCCLEHFQTGALFFRLVFSYLGDEAEVDSLALLHALPRVKICDCDKAKELAQGVTDKLVTWQCESQGSQVMVLCAALVNKLFFDMTALADNLPDRREPPPDEADAMLARALTRVLKECAEPCEQDHSDDFSTLQKFLTVSAKPNEEKVWLDAAKKMAQMCSISFEVESMKSSGDHEGLKAVLRKAIDALKDARPVVETSTMEDPVLDELYHAWMEQHANISYGDCSLRVHEGAISFVGYLVDCLGKAVQQLQQVAGGAPNGQVWHADSAAGAAVDVLATYRETLSQLEAGQIRALLQACVHAMDALEKEVVAYDAVLVNASSQNEGVAKLLSEARAQVTRAKS